MSSSCDSDCLYFDPALHVMRDELNACREQRDLYFQKYTELLHSTGVSSPGTGATGGTVGVSALPVIDTVTPDVAEFPSGSQRIIIPASRSFSLRIIDSDGSATSTLGGSHQYVTYNGDGTIPEDGCLEWSPKPDGSAYPSFYIDVPVGITVFYEYLPVTNN